MAQTKPGNRNGSHGSGCESASAGAGKSGGGVAASASSTSRGNVGDANNDRGRKPTIVSLINRYDNRPAGSRQAPSKHSRQLSSPERDAPRGDPDGLQTGSRDPSTGRRPAGGSPCRPLESDSGGPGPVNAELSELIRSVVRSELSLAIATLQRSLREAIHVLGERIQELEGRLFEKDEELERLTGELGKSRDITEELMDSMDHLETELHDRPLSSSPGPLSRLLETGESFTPEDTAFVAVDIRKSLPDIAVNSSDIASCFRVGGLINLVCSFVRSGLRSVRGNTRAGSS